MKYIYIKSIQFVDHTSITFEIFNYQLMSPGKVIIIYLVLKLIFFSKYANISVISLFVSSFFILILIIIIMMMIFLLDYALYCFLVHPSFRTAKKPEIITKQSYIILELIVHIISKSRFEHILF